MLIVGIIIQPAPAACTNKLINTKQHNQQHDNKKEEEDNSVSFCKF